VQVLSGAPKCPIDEAASAIFNGSAAEGSDLQGLVEKRKKLKIFCILAGAYAAKCLSEELLKSFPNIMKVDGL